MAAIQDIIVKDVEKRRYPAKHYAYLIEVYWSDGKTTTIGRRYCAFFDFQMSLLEMFPEEAGQQDPTKRIIPFLPGKQLFRRTNTKEFALKRMGAITEYCTGIARMPAYMSGCDIVLEFFKPNSDDKTLKKGATLSPEKSAERKNTANEITGPLVLDKYVAVAEYKKENRNELNLKTGEVVEVVEKSENGWWLAANEEGMNGWVPAVYLESLYGETAPQTKERADPGEGEMYEAITDFTASTDEELSFSENDVLEVLEKNLEGWWFAKKLDSQGWVPATYLQKSTALIPISPPPGSEKFGRGYAGRQRSLEKTKKPPPKRSTVRRSLTKAAAAKVQVDFRAKMLKQESIAEEDDEEFAGLYTTMASFESTHPEGLSFRSSETVHVIQKSNEGWWYGRIGDKRGWVPETYLEEQDSKPKTPARPTSPQNKFQLPTPTPLGGRAMISEVLKPLGINGTNAPSKSPKPSRPPAPKVKPGIGQATKVFGGPKVEPRVTSPTKRPDARNPVSPLPAIPNQKGKLPGFIIAGAQPKINLDDYHWYRDITRQEAEDALLDEDQEGYFIVRPSKRGAKQDKPYSLTLYHQNQNWNFHIRHRSDRMYAVGIFKEAEACFTTLPELVKYYMDNPLVIGEEERKVKLVDSPQELYSAC